MNRIAAKQRGRKTRIKGWLGSVPQRSPGALESHSQPDVQEDESGGSEGSSRTEGEQRYRRENCRPTGGRWASFDGHNKSRYKVNDGARLMSVANFVPVVWVRVHM